MSDKIEIVCKECGGGKAPQFIVGGEKPCKGLPPVQTIKVCLCNRKKRDKGE